MDQIKIKILFSTCGKGLEERFFIAEKHISYTTIQYSVGIDGLQKKTKHQGRVIPNEFYVKV